jgi:hypothetical protein
MRLFIFCTTYVKHFSFYKEFSEILTLMRKHLNVKDQLFFYDFNETLIFWTDFRKKTQISGFIKIPPVEVELFHADGQTDMKRLIVPCRNFANAPKKVSGII